MPFKLLSIRINQKQFFYKAWFVETEYQMLNSIWMIDQRQEGLVYLTVRNGVAGNV